jgi:hypothetical protein
MNNHNEQHALQEVTRVEERIKNQIAAAEAAARITVETARRKAVEIIEQARALPIEIDDIPLEQAHCLTTTPESSESIAALDPLIDQLAADAINQLLGILPDEKGSTP